MPEKGENPFSVIVFERNDTEMTEETEETEERRNLL